MSTQVTQEIVEAHEKLTKDFLAGRIGHHQRVAKLKALGITGAQNIDLDNAYGEKFLGETDTIEDKDIFPNGR